MEIDDLDAVLPADICLQVGNKRYAINAPKTWQEVPLVQRMLYLRYLLYSNTDYGWQCLMRHWLLWKGIPEKVLNHKAVFTAARWMEMRYHFRHLDLKSIDGQTPLFSTFRVQNRDFQLIADGFKDGCIYEYAKASDYYDAVMQGKTEKALDLLSVLCRPLVDGKAQAMQHMGDIADRKALLSKLDQNEQTAYLFASVRHFEACKQFIYEKWHPIFQSATESEGHKPTMNLGWDGQIMAQAADLTKLSEVQQTNVHTFCYWLLKKKLDDDAHKAALEDIKTD